MKPIELVARAIANSSRRGGTVLDPRYVRVGVERWQAASAEPRSWSMGTRREDGKPTHPGDRDPAVLHRLAERLEHVASEIGQLVEEEQPWSASVHI